MQYFECWKSFFRQWNIMRFLYQCAHWKLISKLNSVNLCLISDLYTYGLWHRRKWNIPIVQWIVHVTTCIANNKATNFIRSNCDTFQHINHFSAKQMTNTFAHTRRLDFQIYTKCVNRFDNLLVAFTGFYVVHQKASTWSSRERNVIIRKDSFNPQIAIFIMHLLFSKLKH